MFANACKITKELPDSFQFIEGVAADLPILLDGAKLRSIVNQLPIIDFKEVDCLSGQQKLRLYQIYSFLSAAYVSGSASDVKCYTLPRPLSVPFAYVSGIVNHSSWLSPYSYFLYNTKVFGKCNTFTPETVFPIFRFTKTDAELRYINYHAIVEIEGFSAASELKELLDSFLFPFDQGLIEAKLTLVSQSLKRIHFVLNKLRNVCSKNIIFNQVSSYLSPIKGVVFEDCFGETPLNFPGVIYAPSFSLKLIELYLGINWIDPVDSCYQIDQYLQKDDYTSFVSLMGSISKYKQSNEVKDMRKNLGLVAGNLNNPEICQLHLECCSQVKKAIALNNGFFS